MRLFESQEHYHQRKLREALDYLYPARDKSKRQDLCRVANVETVFGSYIDCCSNALLQEVDPISDYQIDSIIIALRGDLNFKDDGEIDHTERVSCYKRTWKPNL